MGHLGKNIQNLSGTLFAFEIFEIAQKTKKLALLSYPLGSSQGCLGVPRHAPCGSVRSHKIFFAFCNHLSTHCATLGMPGHSQAALERAKFFVFWAISKISKANNVPDKF